MTGSIRSANGRTGFAAILLAIAACDPLPQPPPADPATGPTAEPATFVNRVWKVADRSDGGDPGAFYVFLSDGTLVISSPNATPAFGTWHEEGDAMTMVEEGISHNVEVLEITTSQFRIRMHSPGGPPLEIGFVPP